MTSASVNLFAFALLCLTAACSVPAAKPVAALPVTVALVSVRATSAVGTLVASGTVRLKRETPLAFNTSGRIAEVVVREGQLVAAGQMLARLDSTGTDAANAAARAEAVRASADLTRLRKLGSEGWITRPRLEAAEAAATASRARVAQTGFDVRFAQIHAPTAGVILRRQMEPGQMLTAGQPVLTLGELASGFVLRLPLADTALTSLRLGQPALVTLPALSPTPIVATVTEIAARSDDRTGTFQVELRLPAMVGLRSGLIGEARIATAATAIATAVSVPATAVFAARADEGFVYIFDAKSSTVRARLVGLGAVDDRGISITHGLSSGETIVRSGADRLRDGLKVRVAA